MGYGLRSERQPEVAGNNHLIPGIQSGNKSSPTCDDRSGSAPRIDGSAIGALPYEIGLRRALGATRGHIATQFLGEAMLLSIIGGLVGVAMGYGVTAAWASYKGWGVLVPQVAILGGFGAALLIGSLAGLYPAIRASKMSPTEALRAA